MTVVNPKSISGITSITTASGSDNLLTIHTSDANNTERFRIDSTGATKVGSGITLSPDGDIFATGISTFGGGVKITAGDIVMRQPAGTEAKIQINEATTTNSFTIKQTATEARIQTNASQPLNIRAQGGSGSSSHLAFWTRELERFRIEAGGAIGIGTTNPTTYKLHLQGSTSALARFERTDGAFAKVDIKAGTTAGNSYITFSDPAASEVGEINYEHADDSLRINTNSAERFRIDSQGRVGIGGSSLSGKLEVRDSAALGILIRATNTQTTDTNKALRVRNNSDTDTFSVSHKGLVTATTVEDSIGDLRKFPVTNYGSNVVVASHHAGKTLTNTSGGWTVNADTDFAIGEVMRVVNKSGSSQTVFQGGTATLYSSRDNGTSGDHSIKARGSAILICTGADEYYLSGDI